MFDKKASLNNSATARSGSVRVTRLIVLLLAAVLLLCSGFACSGSSGGNASPAPVVSDASGREHKCTLYIECTTILDNMEDFNEDKLEVLPSDGIILEKCEVSFTDGETVFDVLVRETRSRGIHMEHEFTPIYDSAYIEGINNLYEFDCGQGSGWTYSVNGVFPNYGCSKFSLSDGDAIEWHYTCDYGRDVGCEF